MRAEVQFQWCPSYAQLAFDHSLKEQWQQHCLLLHGVMLPLKDGKSSWGDEELYTYNSKLRVVEWITSRLSLVQQGERGKIIVLKEGKRRN